MTTRVAGSWAVTEGVPQLVSFFRGPWLVLGGFAAATAIQFLIDGRPTQIVVSVVLVAATATVVLATRVLAAHRIVPAVLLTSGVLLTLILIIGVNVPLEGEAAVGVLFAVAAGLPFLHGRALGALILAAWLVGVVVALAQQTLPHLQPAQPGGSGAIGVVVALGVFLYVLWQHSRRLRGLIVDREREHLTARLLFAASPIPTWLVDRDSGAILDVNDAAVTGYGHPRETFLRMQLADLRESPAQAVVMKSHRNERHRTRDGSLVDVQIDAHEVTLDGRSVLLVSATDLTGERRSQQQRAQLAAIVDSADDAILSTALDGTVLTWNRGAERLYGYAAGEIVGKSITLTFPPEPKGDIESRLARVAAGERILNLATDRIHRDGHPLRVSVSLAPIQDDAGRTIGVSGIARDIGEQKRNEEALARSQALLAAAEVLADVGSFEVDLATGRVQGSDHLYRMADRAPDEELDYEDFLGIIHHADRPRVRETIEEATRQGADHAYEFRVPRKNGTDRVVSCRARVVSDPDGRPVRIIGTAQDVTDTRQLEHEFRQAQKMEAVGRLAGGIAHDFNNSLTAIIGYGQILSESLAGTPEAEWVEQIAGAARHAAGLTRQLLAFSRRQLLQPEVLDIPALVDELAPMLRLVIGKDVELVTTVEPETGHVRADPGQLQQVLLNLAGNARDAMPDGGLMTISVGNTSLDPTRAATLELPPGPYVCLSVADDGQGMDDATKARIFEPFFTTKEVGKGTGLGLAMVHGVVTQSGGHISFDSELGRGTRFRILLPSVGSAPLPAPVETPEPVPQRLTGRVLLVDDETMVREITRMTLESNGLTVVEAPDAERALEEMDRSRDFDLVISDVVMPGLGGRALAQELRSRGHDVPIIFVSGYPRDSVVTQGVGQSEYPFLAKPFRPSQLIALVRKTLRERREGGPHAALSQPTTGRSRRARTRAAVTR